MNSEVSSNPYNISSLRTLTNLHQHRNHIIQNKWPCGFIRNISNTMKISLLEPETMKVSRLRSITESEYYQFIAKQATELGCHPLKLFQFQRYVPNSTLNCLLIRNYAIKHCLAYYALFAHVKLYAKQFFPSITSSSDIPTM